MAASESVTVTGPSEPTPSRALNLRPGAGSRSSSIDALRGFNMLWIIGVNTLVYKAHELFPNAVTAILDRQLRHPAWDEGFTFYDLIWPLFLFIAGTVIPVSVRRRQEEGLTSIELHLFILRRALVVFFIGVLMTGPLTYDLSQLLAVRWWGVLQRIAVCYLVAGILVVHTGWRVQVALSVMILLGYWAALTLLEIAGRGPGVASRDGCWVYAFGLPDNFVTTPLSLPSMLLGVWAGQWLRSERPERQRIAGLTLAGIALLGVSYIWALWFPMIKRIWSSTYVVYAGGWSLLLLALFHWAIDVRGWRRWAFVFVVIGMNSIPIYFLTNSRTVVDFEWIAKLFLQGAMDRTGIVRAQPLLLISGALVVKWLFLWVLYKRRLFFRA